MLPCVGNDPKILEEVELRRPDIVFDDFLQIDLGGKVVELHYFGPANTPGDTITYVPEAKVAWTGNMTGGNLIVSLESDAPTYMNSIARFAQALEVETLIPAHNPISGPELLGGYMQYLSDVTQAVRGAHSAGWTLTEAMERIQLDLDRPYAPPADYPRFDFFGDLHSYTVMKNLPVPRGVTAHASGAPPRLEKQPPGLLVRVKTDRGGRFCKPMRFSRMDYPNARSSGLLKKSPDRVKATPLPPP